MGGKAVTSVQHEIESLEEQLRQAELSPDPAFFEQYIDDEMIFVADGKASRPKQHIVETHRQSKGRKFTRVEMTDMTIIGHGTSAAVTCQGTYEGPQGTHVLKFMRVWAKKPDGWKIVAGSMI